MYLKMYSYFSKAATPHCLFDFTDIWRELESQSLGWEFQAFLQSKKSNHLICQLCLCFIAYIVIYYRKCQICPVWRCLFLTIAFLCHFRLIQSSINILKTFWQFVPVGSVQCFVRSCSKNQFYFIGPWSKLQKSLYAVSSVLSQLCSTLIGFCFTSSQLVQLDNLFAYWNVDSILFSNHSADEALVSHSVIAVLHLASTSVDSAKSLFVLFCFFETQLHYCAHTEQS